MLGFLKSNISRMFYVLVFVGVVFFLLGFFVVGFLCFLFVLGVLCCWCFREVVCFVCLLLVWGGGGVTKIRSRAIR